MKKTRPGMEQFLSLNFNFWGNLDFPQKNL